MVGVDVDDSASTRHQAARRRTRVIGMSNSTCHAARGGVQLQLHRMSSVFFYCEKPAAETRNVACTVHCINKSNCARRGIAAIFGC